MRMRLMTVPFLFSFISLFSPQLYSAVAPTTTGQNVTEKSAAKDVDVRVLGRTGHVLISRKDQVFAVAQIRPFNATITPVLSIEDAAIALKSTAPKDQPLVADSEDQERVREFVYPLPTLIANDELSVLLRTRKVSYGTRMLVNGLIRGPSQLDLAPDETLPAPAPLELALQIYPDAQGKPPRLTYLDGRLQPFLDNPETRDEAEKRDVAGRILQARSLVFEGAGGFRVNIARSGPVSWTLIRSGQGWLLRQKLLPAPRDATNIGSFILYLGGWTDEAKAEVSEITLNHPQVAARDRIEGSARIYASGANVYNLSELSLIAEIAFPPLPSGVILRKRLPCFFYEGPSDHPCEGEFRFRFSPPQEGVYGVRLLSISSSGQVYSEAVAFHAAPPASAGFIKTNSTTNTFAYDNGEPFVPIGVRLVLPPEKVSSAKLKNVFREMARRGVNTLHLTLSRRTFPFEKESAGSYDADVAACLDDIFCAAQVRGIHLILGLEDGDDLGKFSDQHPYFREHGGPLSASPEFFRDVKVRKLYQSRLTYIAARYGAYRSLLSWELIDGVERVWPAICKNPEDRSLPPGEADLSRRGRRDIQDWARESAQYLHGLDQHGHPVCISTGLGIDATLPWTDLEKIGTLDWIFRHVTVPRTTREAEPVQLDETNLLARWLKNSREPGSAHKPILFELINSEQTPTVPSTESKITLSARTQLGRNLVHAGWACGAAGPVILNWNLNSADAKPEDSLADLYPVLNLVGNSLSIITQKEGNELRYISGEIQSTPPLRYWGRAARRGLCVWIQDARASVASSTLTEIEGIELKLPGLEEGKYWVKWIDPVSGRLLKQEAYDAPAKKIDPTISTVAIVAPLQLLIPKIKEARIIAIEPQTLK